MKKFTLFKTFTLAALMMSLATSGWGQQVIGSFPTMDGGFEGQTAGTPATASSIATGVQRTDWTVQNTSGTSTIFSTGGRSGQNFITFGATAARRLQSPTAQDKALANATSYTVQFFYLTSGSAGASNGQVGNSPDGTGQPGTYASLTLSGTNGVWTKVTQSQTSGSSASDPRYGIGIIRFSAASGVNIDIDDYVIYAGALDVTPPSAPSTVTVGNATASSLEVSWLAASGGVDGGGYVVVRYSTNPNANNDPNQNGIYAVGNTITNGTDALVGTVRYIGTGLSFTDNVGLSAGTQYWYKVYTVDKAFNYSEENLGTSTTTGGATPTLSVSPSSLTGFSYVVGSGPSAEQLFTVSGTNLTGDITITPPANYEISIGTGGAFVATNPVILTQSGGTVPATTIYVRLKSGLTVGLYSESISLSSAGAESRTVSLAGQVLSSPANFRSVATGLWSAAATWEASPDGIAWLAADRSPDNSDLSILIRTGHVVTVNAAVAADQIEIQNGATLVHSAGTFSIANGAGNDVVVHSGGVFTFGVNPAPVFATNATCLVNPGGILRIAATGIIGTGAVAHSASIVFTTGSVLEYTPISEFAASGVTYFPHVDAATIPIFRVTSVTGTPGGSSPTIINGILEANSSFTWAGTGLKTFRNGIRGSGSLTQAAGAGKWLITGADAIMGGTGDFNLTTGLDIAAGSHVRVTGNRRITGGLVTVIGGGSLTLESGNMLTIGSTATLTVHGTLTNNAGDGGLVLRSGASMIHNTAGVAATMERFFAGAAHWRLVASPVANQAISGPWIPATPNHGYDFYAWDEPASTWRNQKEGANNLTHFLPGRGYLVSFQAAGLTQGFAGPLNNGNVVVPVVRENPGAFRGANLLGNPYPSSIDWNLADRTLFADDFAYIYDPIPGGGGSYVPVNGAVAGARIAPNQGFFVIKSTAVPADFTFTNAMRTHGGVFKSAPADPAITITLQQGEFYDRAQIVQLQDATTARERSDALKFFSYNPMMPQVFSLSSDAVQLAVNSTGPISEDASFAIGVLTPSTGTYTLRVDGLQEILAGRPAFLLDKVTGASHNLRTQSHISFHAVQSSTAIDRFVLNFVQPTGVGNNLPVDATLVYFANGMLHIQFPAEESNRQLQVIDLSGRVVFSKRLQGMDSAVSVPLYLDNGAYIVRITGDTSAVNRRIWVR